MRTTAYNVVAAVALVTTGCHAYEPYPATPSTEAARALNELKTLPSYEDTMAEVQAAIDEIVATTSKIAPTITWETPEEGSSGNCEAPYEQTDGQRYFLPHHVGVGAQLSESDWAAILDATQHAAAKIGATGMQVMQDQPGFHDVWFSGPTGIFIKVSYKGNLVVSGYTGCRLPRDRK